MAAIEHSHMPDWLSARVKATPDKPFLHIDKESYSFAELDRLVQATCALIREHADISAGDHVGLLLPNGFALRPELAGIDAPGRGCCAIEHALAALRAQLAVRQ